MVTKYKIDYLTIEGFQSIRRLERLPLGNLNVLIGANGAGKSNFVAYFRMLREMVEQRLQVWVRVEAGSERLLTYGSKETTAIKSHIEFGEMSYDFVLKPTRDATFIFDEELVRHASQAESFGSGHYEAKLRDSQNATAQQIHESIVNWRIFHFNDASIFARVKLKTELQDNQYFRPAGSNLAAYLYWLQRNHMAVYQKIRKTVKLALPFFDDFVLIPEEPRPDEFFIQLMWRQVKSDYHFMPHQLSDGSLRFICLVTALMQPNPPSTIIIDEPELGLHPYAIGLLGSLLRSASVDSQVIIATQSMVLMNEFSLDNIIVLERADGVSQFKRLTEAEFDSWLEDYKIGELWEMNVLGGIP